MQTLVYSQLLIVRLMKSSLRHLYDQHIYKTSQHTCHMLLTNWVRASLCCVAHMNIVVCHWELSGEVRDRWDVTVEACRRKSNESRWKRGATWLWSHYFTHAQMHAVLRGAAQPLTHIHTYIHWNTCPTSVFLSPLNLSLWVGWGDSRWGVNVEIPAVGLLDYAPLILVC